MNLMLEIAKLVTDPQAVVTDGLTVNVTVKSLAGLIRRAEQAERHVTELQTSNSDLLMRSRRAEQAEGEVMELSMTLRMLTEPQREEVLWFMKEMARKLARNRFKAGWSGDSVPSLMERVHEEVRELVEVVSKEAAGYHVVQEAADVANMVMMVAANVRAHGREREHGQ